MNAIGVLPNAMDATAGWSLCLFSQFRLAEIASGEEVSLPGKRERVLLAYLALSPNSRASRLRLTTLLWGDAADQATLDNLRVCLWGLRKALGDTKRQIIASKGEDIVLDLNFFQVDVLSFRQLAADIRTNELNAAVNLYTGEFLGEFGIESEEFESWRREEAIRCSDQAIKAHSTLMRSREDDGEIERAIDAGLRILRIDPLHEPAVRALMRLYAGGGRRGAAIQLYRTLTESLKSELSVQPGAETRALFAEIARGEEIATQPQTVAATALVVRTHPPAIADIFVVPTQYSAARRALRGARKWLIPSGAIAAMLVILAVYQFIPVMPAHRTAAATTAGPSQQARAVSIAILPFANLSTDPSQDFFSDGMTEEITAALTRVPNLSVVARTSAFQFKNEKINARVAGKALGARYVINGAVRKAGNRVRITAQLVVTDTGIAVWSDSYDRELTDVFAIQEEIARAITTSLRTQLGLKPDENLVKNRDIDTDSYLQFLRARALVRIRDAIALERALPDAMALLEPIVTRYPDYAPAWAQLALIYERMPIYLRNAENTPLEVRRSASDTWLAKAEAASERAIALDPTAADGYSSLGLSMAMRGRLLRADELFSRALALDPFYPEALHSYANLLSGVGHHKEALATRERVASIEPFVPVYHSNLAELRWINGQTEAVIGQLKTRPPQALLARIYAATGHDSEAVDILRRIPPETFPDGMLENAERLMRTSSADEVSPRTLPAMNANLNFIYLHVGVLERIIQPLEYSVAAGYLPPLGMSFVWQPSFSPLRRTERFKAFARNYGLVEYWRAKGWPAECRPGDGNDFECN